MGVKDNFSTTVTNGTGRPQEPKAAVTSEKPGAAMSRGKPEPDVNSPSPLSQPQFQRSPEEQQYLDGRLREASGKGEMGTLRYMVRSGAGLEAYDSFGRTPLMMAVIAGKYEAAEFLLQSKANPNVKDAIYEWSALIHAIHARDLKMVKLLADNGADPAMPCAGLTPLDTARFYDSVADSGIYEFLRQHIAR